MRSCTYQFMLSCICLKVKSCMKYDFHLFVMSIIFLYYTITVFFFYSMPIFKTKTCQFDLGCNRMHCLLCENILYFYFYKAGTINFNFKLMIRTCETTDVNNCVEEKDCEILHEFINKLIYCINLFFTVTFVTDFMASRKPNSFYFFDPK